MLTKIEQVIKRQLFKDSSDGMKGLVSNNINMLNEYKSTINIKNIDMLTASRAAADLVRTDDSIVDP